MRFKGTVILTSWVTLALLSACPRTTDKWADVFFQVCSGLFMFCSSTRSPLSP